MSRAGFSGGAARRKRIRCSGSPAPSPSWQGADPMSDLFRKKTIAVGADQPGEHRLARTLSWPHLVALGVGAIVGTGILTLIGVGADRAGPAVLLSFVIEGVIRPCAALASASQSSLMQASVSAQQSSLVVSG